MSNHPIPPGPGYWGPYNNTQQWASHPSSLGSMPPNISFNQNPSSAPQNFNNLENFYANANLPGFGGPGATGSLPPPPFAFPGTFPPPPHFPPMPNMGYPLMALPPMPSHVPPSRPSTNDLAYSAPSNAPDSRPMTTASSKLDLDREEGELTDIEGPATVEAQRNSELSARRAPGDSFGSQKSNMARNTRKQPQTKVSDGLKNVHHSVVAPRNNRRTVSSEPEEGEASPEPRYSNRDSGSPYNPPMPTNAVSPSVLKRSPEAFRPSGDSIADINLPLPTSTEIQAPPHASKSLAQLRVQAQGALLSLAPHSIRYSELVGEGIDPMVLKQLYEEVGIKVPTTPPTEIDLGAASHEEIHLVTSPPAAAEQATQLAPQLEPEMNATQSSAPTEPSSTPPHSTQVTATKPMERKEVIARMLAAKAAKRSPGYAQPQADAAKTASAPILSATVEESTTSTSSQDLSSKEKESRVKEKNKAQTELARQRIEQLKKKGLMRNQQKSQSDSQLSDKEQQDSVQRSPEAPAPTIVQHPLPERPPVPESNSLEDIPVPESDFLDRIPGLFMTEEVQGAANSVHVTPVQDSVVDSATYTRTIQRKRPRASDFDDPIPMPKRAFSNGMIHAPPERLVIDISDDEFYDNDEDVEMVSTNLANGSDILTVEGISPAYLPPAESLPHRPATSQSQGFSTSSTPNNYRNSEQEDLRKKNLEIQAMHRRIAELEQRKKARLASRTQSPHTSDLSPPELVSMTPVPIPTVASIIDPDIENNLPPLDVEVLRRMKSKIVRIQEIEAGVPSLDAEIKKSETRLASLEKLSLDLAKGKEGRRQLLEELTTLKAELNGLSLDQVNAALLRLETKEELPVEIVQGMLRRLSIPEFQHSNTATYKSYAIAPGYEKETSDDDFADPEIETNVQVQDTSAHISENTLAEPPMNVPNDAEDSLGVNGAEGEPSDTSMSDDSSSSMDESTDSSGSSSASVNEEMPDALNPGRDLSVPMDEITTTATSDIPNGFDAEDEVQSEHPPNITPLQTDIASDAGDNLVTETQASRESSISEAYEPPEPDDSASSAGSNYSPAPSPEFPSPAADMDVSGSSEKQSQEVGEPLTGKAQELDFQQPSQYHQFGILDNERRPEDSERKFSPYTSPLKLFKAYRYHPTYSDNVSGGYRSLTYSHSIDPMNYLCPFEASGGICNDRSCEFQHFRDMALSDDRILVQMGSLREGKTPEECDKYVAGLKGTINDMRRDKVKDMNTVATEIAAYRRRFLQDPSRVLAL
ncbi:hypothetical protein BDW59DRAFT_150825 [Aspergillus cavernicola]|uniref:Putative zinc-finger domain-containing protein n=1 Tax=Aspergillus cavernicola TaxID=176166 RepID=A0ABR4HYC5_9EURO